MTPPIQESDNSGFDVPGYLLAATPPRPGRPESTELRMQVPRRLLEIFDAVSIARGQERFALVLEELTKSADRWVHEASLIQRVTRGNPTPPEATGDPSEPGRWNK